MTNTTLGESSGQLLVQDALGRVRTPWEKREQILDEYERSGMTAAALAESVGVKYSTLASWLQQRRKGRVSLATPTTVQWVEAVAGRDVGSPAVSGVGMRVQIGPAVWLEVSSVQQAAWAGEVLRVMGVAGC